MVHLSPSVRLRERVLGSDWLLDVLMLCSRRTVDEAGREVWIHNGTYWNLRSKPGFANTPNPDLW